MRLRGTNQEFNRPFNRRIIIEEIRRRGPVTKAEIASAVGLTFQTVTTIVQELEALQLVTSERTAPKGRGQPPIRLTINPEGGFTLGFHVTPQVIEAALVNLKGEIVARLRKELSTSGPNTVFSEIGKLTDRLRKKTNVSRILGGGMVMPGPFGVDSMSFVGPTTLKGWHGVDIQSRLSEAIGAPAFVDVDVVAAALGERLYGKASALGTFYYLYFGWGLGGVVVSDGRPLRGAHGNAVEIGHLPLVPGGEACICGNHGCLERYLSFEALHRRIEAEGPAGRANWIRETAPLFRAAIRCIETLYDPATIFVGFYGHGDVLRDLIAAAQPLDNSIAARSDRTLPRLMLTEHGDDAILRGAAALAMDGVLAPTTELLLVKPRHQNDRPGKLSSLPEMLNQ
jgi:predicted NBD/HSP70 family sugar kinase